jgi:hypothetical protein
MEDAAGLSGEEGVSTVRGAGRGAEDDGKNKEKTTHTGKMRLGAIGFRDR